jgi:hypothetical protein
MRFPHASKLVALTAIILSGVFLGVLTMEFRQELRITYFRKTDEYISRAAALAVAWIVFWVIMRWSGSSHRRSAVVSLVLAVVWLSITMIAIFIRGISFA